MFLSLPPSLPPSIPPSLPADGEEQFYVLPEEKAGSEELTVHRELLTTTQPLKTKVDRNLQVCSPLSRIPRHLGMGLTSTRTTFGSSVQVFRAYLSIVNGLRLGMFDIVCATQMLSH